MRYWLFGVILLCLVSSATAVEPRRMWTSGKFTVEATFVGFNEGKVDLDTGAKIVSIPETKLSEADQAYLRELRKRWITVNVLPTGFDWEFDSDTANSAIRKYEAAARELHESYEQSIKKLDKKQERERTGLSTKQGQQRKRVLREAVVTLEKAVAAERKAGNLDEAVRIRKAVAKLKKGFSQPPPAPERPKQTLPKQTIPSTTETTSGRSWEAQLNDFLGEWKWGARGMKDRVTFNADGTATATWGGEGTWEKTKQRIVIKWHNNKTTYGSPKWDTINLPLDLDNVTGDSWVGPDMLRAEKIR